MGSKTLTCTVVALALVVLVSAVTAEKKSTDSEKGKGGKHEGKMGKGKGKGGCVYSVCSSCMKPATVSTVNGKADPTSASLAAQRTFAQNWTLAMDEMKQEMQTKMKNFNFTRSKSAGEANNATKIEGEGKARKMHWNATTQRNMTRSFKNKMSNHVLMYGMMKTGIVVFDTTKNSSSFNMAKVNAAVSELMPKDSKKFMDTLNENLKKNSLDTSNANLVKDQGAVMKSYMDSVKAACKQVCPQSTVSPQAAKAQTDDEDDDDDSEE